MASKTLESSTDLELIAELRRRDPAWAVLKFTSDQMKQMAKNCAAPAVSINPSYSPYNFNTSGGNY